MKFKLLLPLLLTACNSYHVGTMGLNISNDKISITPMQANIKIDSSSKIIGTANCTNLLWAFDLIPGDRAYGATLQTTEGISTSDDCVAAATFNALSQKNADIIIAPQYMMSRNGILCFGQRCLIGTTYLTVEGYPATISSITTK